MPKYTKEQLKQIATEIKNFKTQALKIRTIQNLRDTYKISDEQIKRIVDIISATPKRILGFQDAILYLLDTGILGPSEGKKFSERLNKDVNSYSREQRAKAMIIVGTVYNVVTNMGKSALDYILQRKERALREKEKRNEELKFILGRGKSRTEKTENQIINSKIFREYKEDLRQLKYKYGNLLPEIIRVPKRVKVHEGEIVGLPHYYNPMQTGTELERQALKAEYKTRGEEE